MASITYSTFTTLYGIDTSASDFSAAEIESIMDHAIDMLNLQGRDRFTIKNMSGSAGSKTVTLKSHQSGAVLHVAWMIYKGRNPETASIGALSYVPSSVLVNPTAVKMFYDYVDSLVAFEETPSGKVG
jgi:hypothetical protein